MNSDGSPLVFLHIPKTGGTSLARAIARHYPAKRRAEPVNLTAAFVGASNLEGKFVHGHPGRGVAPVLPPSSRVITLLRRPRDQVVSNYLHIRRNPRDPLFWHARLLGLSGVLKARPDLVLFQSICLLDALRPQDDSGADQVRGRLGDIAAFLDRLAFVGVLERMDESCEVLGRLTALALEPERANPARLFGVPTSGPRIDALRAEYDQMKADPEIAWRAALEERVYAHANRLLDQAAAARL